MCRAATCKVCGKTTWAGCGQHIAEVKRTVPAEFVKVDEATGSQAAGW